MLCKKRYGEQTTGNKALARIIMAYYSLRICAKCWAQNVPVHMFNTCEVLAFSIKFGTSEEKQILLCSFNADT
jgi:hypothetical protein